jgi:hypothetical protein
MYVGLQYQFVKLEEAASGYYITGGVVQPVAGEPSLGTPHMRPRDDTDRRILTTNGVPAGWTLVTPAAGLIPAGCRLIRVRAYAYITVANAPNYQFWYFSDVDTQTIAAAYQSKNVGCCMVDAETNSTYRTMTEFDIPLDSLGRFYYAQEAGGILNGNGLILIYRENNL